MSAMPESARPTALVTAPVRGAGLDLLHELAEVVVDPWIDQRPLRLYSSAQLAERAAAEGADVLIVEADSVKGPVFDLAGNHILEFRSTWRREPDGRWKIIFDDGACKCAERKPAE